MIDREAHQIKARDTRSGDLKTYEYDKLILAQGGRPIKPELPGADYEHVFTLWTLEDMDKIAHFINDNKPRTAVVVGGGFIGLEMVEALVKRGISITVIRIINQVSAYIDLRQRTIMEQPVIVIVIS